MAYKVFTNGSPLPASDLNTYLMNQSVMVFADSTARSAALTSPTEGMTTYLEDTNKVEVWTGAAWTDINDNSNAILKSTVTTAGDLIVANGNASVTRLGIGTNGQVLSSNGTTATWTTPSGGGGLTLLASGSFSGSTVISSISQDYKALKMIFTNVYRSAASFGFQFRNSGTAQNVNYWKEEYNGSSWSFSNGNNQASIFYASFDNTPGNGQLILDLWNYTSTGARQFTVTASPQTGNSRYVYSEGAIRSASGSAINELNVFVDSGNYEIYGVN